MAKFSLTELPSSRYGEWDLFVRSHPLGGIAQLSSWKVAIERAFSHIRGKICAVVDKEGRIFGGLALYTSKSALSGRRATSVPFSTLCDPLLEADMSWADVECGILGQLAHEVKQIRVWTFRSAPNFTIAGSAFVPVSSFTHHYVDLSNGIDSVYTAFHETAVKQPIARALKNDLTLKLGDNHSSVSVFYDLYVKTRRRLGLPPIPERLFANLWLAFHGQGNLRLLFAYHKDQPIAAVLLLCYNDVVCMEYAVEDDGRRNLKPSHFLYWRAIQMAHQEGFRIFSFGRTGKENEGLRAFKRRWGTKETDLTMMVYPGDCGEPRERQPVAFQGAKGIIALLPVPVLKVLGRVVYSQA